MEGKSGGGAKGKKGTNLEAFVLEDFLDGDVITFMCTSDETGLEDNAKGAVSDDLAVGIGQVLLVTRLSVRSNDLDVLVGVFDGYGL